MPTDENETVYQIAVPRSVWFQIDKLAAQIQEPSVIYDGNLLTMAQVVIEDNKRRATLIRNLVPDLP